MPSSPPRVTSSSTAINRPSQRQQAAAAQGGLLRRAHDDQRAGARERTAAAEAEPGDTPDAPPEWVTVSNKNPGFSIKRIEKRTVKYRVPVMAILMKMFFVLSFVPLVITAAIAQPSSTYGPGYPDPLPESSPLRIKLRIV
jgi:hypothetical protein